MKFVISLLWVLCACCLQGCGPNPESQIQKNISYLRLIANMINGFQATTGRLPVSIDEALNATGKTLPNRGDVFGGTLIYYKVDNSAFILRSFGVNGKNERGTGDDVQINFIKGMEVTRSTLIRFVKATYSDEWMAHVIVLGDEP